MKILFMDLIMSIRRNQREMDHFKWEIRVFLDLKKGIIKIIKSFVR